MLLKLKQLRKLSKKQNQKSKKYFQFLNKGDSLERGIRKSRTGNVVSDKMEKTIVVEVEYHYKHPLYKKILKKVKNYKVHDLFL